MSEKHGASLSQFRTLTARYSVDNRGRRVVVTIEDSKGRRSIDDFCVVSRRTLDKFELIIPLPKHGNRHFVGAAYTAEFDLYWTFAASTAWAQSAFRHDDVDLIHANELG